MKAKVKRQKKFLELEEIATRLRYSKPDYLADTEVHRAWDKQWMRTVGEIGQGAIKKYPRMNLERFYLDCGVEKK